MSSPFYSLERSSKGQFGLDGIEFVTVKSPALKGRADVCTYLPREAQGGSDVPLVILLHGVNGSCWAWAAAGGAHQTLQAMIDTGKSEPMILAMPSDGLRGCGSGYLSVPGSANYERWIVDDLPLLARELYPEFTENSPIYLAGLSMGGYATLRLGAKYPSRFRALSGHSSITTFQGLSHYLEEDLSTLGAHSNDEEDVLPWMLRNRISLPPFSFDCGSEDRLLLANRRLHHALTTANILHRYREYPGAHTWEYWHQHISDSFAFFNQHLP